MPAYRSDAEAEIREPVVARLREMVPGCRIIHEINAESFGNRIDVLAVGTDRLVAVEIKSERDTLKRLPDQIKAMRSVTHETCVAIHEKFLKQSHGSVYPPDEARNATVWVYPRLERKGHVQCGAEWQDRDGWKKTFRCLPIGAMEMLWRNELHNICRTLDVTRASHLTRHEAMDEIRWIMSGQKITETVCATLRNRACVEADPVGLPGVTA